MNAGDLDKRITIQASTKTRNEYGEEVLTWTDVATIWASKVHKASREFFAASKINAETTDLFIARYRYGITTKMQVSFEGKTYGIIGADDPDGQKRELQILCKEVS